ncbi:MAG TPA: alpha/beta hydrolase, partial [Chitinophagaceae bacterium]|nr:alpha/beta hydrolase [Chitinophagaceae bacterium]
NISVFRGTPRKDWFIRGTKKFRIIPGTIIPLFDGSTPLKSSHTTLCLPFQFSQPNYYFMRTKPAVNMRLTGRAVALILILCCISLYSNCQPNLNRPTKVGYAPVNGLKMYYEIYGEGEPLILLHGAFNTIHLAFGTLIPDLARNRQIIAVELQGHGHTADIDRPFSFESMADDVAALLKYLKVDSADVFGYSMGGCIAWQLAIRHPKSVRKLIVASGVYKYEGWTPETRAILPNITPQVFEGTPIKSEYDSVAPDPKHWTQFVNKMKKFITTPYNFTAEKIKEIKSPTLIIAGDGDGVLPEHAVEMFRLRHGKYMVDFGPAPTTQLAILPGTSHISVMMQTNWLVSMITPFLDASAH